MGSAIAMQVALVEPARVAALVLVGSATRLKVNPALMNLAASQDTYHQAIERLVAWSFSRHAPPRLKQLALRRLRETPQAVLHSDLLACDAFDISGQVADISTTAFVICGVEDRMTPVSEAQALSEMLRQARLEVMADAGHMPMLEQPLAFAALLQAYIFA
jgi:pimeloyl-ACP methyl ester carboxylesterase